MHSIADTGLNLIQLPVQMLHGSQFYIVTAINVSQENAVHAHGSEVTNQNLLC